MQTLEKTNELERLLPAGFTARAVAMDDVEEVVALLNAAGEKLIGSSSKFTTTMYQNSWTAPGFNMETDTQIVVAPDGKIAGYYEVNDHEPHVTLQCWGRVHPVYENMGVGTYLLNWAEARARQAIPYAPKDARVTMLCFVISLNTAATKLFEDYGMAMIRHNLRMVIDLNETPAPAQFPSGITVRTMVRPDDDGAVLQTIRDSFRDHWGFVETPFEEDLKDFKHYMDNDESFDSSLQFLAMDGEKIVGVSLGAPRTSDDAKMGWVSTLGVVREWRRHGVALALLHHTFDEFYKRGLRKVALGVDAQSLTGATKLYERAGMRPDPMRQYSNYEKELRAGKDLSVQSL